MKGPAPPRPKKPPSPQKLKLLCSFGGAFVPRGPTGELRYTGGETRILAVDRRGIDISKLRSRLSEFCPDCSLSLKYQLLGAPSRTDLISIKTDDDIRLMVDDYDRFVAGGKASRLRLFLCDPSPSPLEYVAPKNPIPISVDGSCSQFLGFSGEKKLLERETALGNLNRDSNLREHGHSCLSLGVKVFGTHITSTHVNAIQYLGGDSMVNASRVGNHGGSNDASFSEFRERFARGVGFNRPVTAACCMGQPSCHGSLSSNSYTIQRRPRKTVNANAGKMNRENVIPCYTAESCLAPVSYSSQSYRRIPQSNLFGVSNGLASVFQSRSRNHLFGGNEIRGHEIFQYNTRVSQIGSNNSVAEQICDGRRCLPKCHTGLRPRSIIPRIIQGNARQSSLGKPVGVRSNKGVMREQFLKPVQEKNLAKHPNGWGGLSAMKSVQQKHQGSALNFVNSQLPPVISGDPILLLGNASSGFDLLHTSGVGKDVTQSHGSSRYDPFDSTLQCTSKGGGSTCFATTTEHDSCDLNEELRFVGSVKSGHAAALPSAFSCSCNAHDKDVEKVGTKLGDVTTIPNSGFKVKLDISEPVDTISSSSSFMDICSHKLPSNLCMHQLFLPSSAKVYPPEPFSSHSSSNILESDACRPGMVVPLQKPDSCIQLNKRDLKESKACHSGQLRENGAEDTDSEPINGRTDISSKCAVEFLQPTSLMVAEMPLAAEREFTDVKKEEIMSSISYMEDKFWQDDVVKSTSNCCKGAGETVFKLPTVYSHLATQELQTIKNCDLEEIKELGSGTYGTVFHGKWKGSDVAIKRLKPSCFAGGESGEERLVADFWKEAHLLAQIHHPNVVAFYGVVSDGPVTNLATVTEYMVNGSLKQVLQRKDRIIDRRKRLIIAMDAAFGMEYLHEKNIVHFDLKSHNFLVNMKDPNRPVCKIGDLGLSKVKRRTLVSGGIRGTIPWMAPELLSSESNMVTEKVDVYSFGIVMWELLTGLEPHRDMHWKEIIAGIIKGDLRPEVPSRCDPAWKSLMERCWSSNPASRPAFSEISKELRTIAASMNIK